MISDILTIESEVGITKQIPTKPNKKKNQLSNTIAAGYMTEREKVSSICEAISRCRNIVKNIERKRNIRLFGVLQKGGKG